MIKIFDLDLLSDEQKEAYTLISKSEKNLVINRNWGILGTKPLERILNFIRSPCEEVIGGDNNCQIVLGRDRPNMIMGTGYSPKGAQNAGAIDIVVGRMASVNPADGTLVNPSFKADAARIYISQTTDIDTNFGIAPGKIGSVKGRSGIGIKADGVRIIGREGIKIVTGARTDDGEGTETNSKGMNVLAVPKIELNAGNIDPDASKAANTGSEFALPQPNALQGVGRGENIVDAFTDLVKILDSILGMVNNFMTSQIKINTAISPAIAFIPYIGSAAASNVVRDTLDEMISSKSKSFPHRYTLKRKFTDDYLSTSGAKYLASSNVIST